ncbi:hypothetical protein [Bernardetia sp.]|uniref:hypothetical protein n=1 Tax=Bernardetia sp. TaxID=1937974 RepID=UPI0025BEC583|nr:hypothetical protein [Bernardetia sp.]
MKNKKSLKKAFGINEFGMIDYPIKISNVRISRILNGNTRGCSFCFPHGYETNNSKYGKYQRCWKKYRKTQFK